jgi:hypothetical protein
LFKKKNNNNLLFEVEEFIAYRSAQRTIMAPEALDGRIATTAEQPA